MKTYVYDLETYYNFTSGIFINLNDINDKHVFVMFGDRNDLPELTEFLHQENLTLVSHNGLGFDDIILQAILNYPQVKSEDLKRLADKLIKRDLDFLKSSIYKELKYAARLWQPIDTMEIFRLNKQRVALKYAGVILQYHTVQDLPVKPNDLIQPEQVELMLKYNEHDVLITRLLYLYAEGIGELKTRRDATNLFDVNLLTANRTDIGKTVFNKVYAEKTGKKRDQFKDLRTPREVIKVSECLPDNIVFETPELKQLHENIKALKLNVYNNYKYSMEVFFAGNHYDIGVGGLHSRDKERPGIWESKNGDLIIDADITSMYPANQLNNNFFPEHLGSEFPSVFKWIVDTRVNAKHTGEKALSDVLKIAINSEYGLTNSEYYWLYDPKVMVSVTVSGQMYLLNLIEKLVLADFEVISANTDGITTIVPEKRITEYKEVCDIWMERTKFGLEWVLYTKYARRDVNNYIAIKKDIYTDKDGKLIIPEIPDSWKPTPKNVKTKGVFVPGIWADDNWGVSENSYWRQPIVLGSTLKSYKYPIVAIALYEYFVNGVDPETTIRNEKNIHNFVMTQRVDVNKFTPIYIEVKNGKIVKRELQKTNRFICSTVGGSIVKERTDGSFINLLSGKSAVVLDEIEDINADNYPISYDYYLDEVNKTLEIVQPREILLF